MSELTEEQRHQLPEKEDKSKYTFMIVDDSEFMVNNLKRIITSFGGEVVMTAANGAAAVLKYQALPVKPDLITMDLTMPNMGGSSAIAMIMKDNPHQRIVVVSALGHKEAIQDAIMKGAKHFIVKPFQRDNVYKIFRAVLTGKA